MYCADVEDDGGGKTTEEMTIEDLGLYKGQKIYYLFDFGDMWEFELNLIKIDKNSPLLLRPIIIKEKGEAPLQYPIWE
ncbi:MAG: hypothetical protein PHE70_03735 [Tepidanaerobacteraceae bacterium]|nr:hypothetical protein [Tepidanaerobacteraceae bacterium]